MALRKRLPVNHRRLGVGGGEWRPPRNPGSIGGVEVALRQGELCFKTLGSNPKWVPLSGKSSQHCHCIQKRVSREQALHWRVHCPHWT